MNILILDDNISVALSLSTEIKKIFPNYTIECYNKVNDLLLDIHALTPAIIFLDIYIPNSSGIKLSNDIFNKNKNVAIILYSGQPKETFDVYEGHHVYFLEKPFIESKIKKAIEIALSHLSDIFFTFEFARKKSAISIYDIVYLESSARLIKIYTTTEIYSFYDTLDCIEVKWENTFIRVSKSFLINPLFIDKLFDNYVILKKTHNSEALIKINISRAYKKKVLKNELFTIHN